MTADDWLNYAYDGDARERTLAASAFRSDPDSFAGNVWCACATGDESTIRKTISTDSGWVNRAGGPLNMPPLVAVTHSMLILDPAFEQQLLNSARLLLDNGADVNGSRIDRRWPDAPLSALYGAAGRTHHAGMTKLLLQAGANPDDNESLYHSLEGADETCTRLLLESGARVTGTNAIARAIDYGKLHLVQLMLQHGGDARERPWVHHAILRGRSLPFIQALIEAGADLHAANKDGISLYRFAQLHGRADVVAILRSAGIEEPLTDEEQFVAACARGDGATARALQSKLPDIFSRLTKKQLEAMPQEADIGNLRAVETMLELGWPREVKIAWDATALNLAAYRGDAGMVDLLLQHGADWHTKQSFGGNVFGTLSYASQTDVEDPSAPRDYVRCARALIAHGAPLPKDSYTFSAEVTEYFDSVRDNGRPGAQ